MGRSHFVGQSPATGKKRQKWYTAASRREAQAILTEHWRTWRAGTWTPPTRMTTGKFSLKWFGDYARGAVGSVSLANDAAMIRRQVIPAIRHLPLARLGPPALHGYYAQNWQPA